jgi:hypothetical protein
MAFEPREGSGALFKNDKQGNEAWADYQGDIMIGGKQYWLSAWIKGGDGGKPKFMSLSAKPKDARSQKAPLNANNQADESDVPF